jgi:hypothetical protein
VCALVAVCAGCSRPPLERATAARGGPLTSLSRDVKPTSGGLPGQLDVALDHRARPAALTLETYVTSRRPRRQGVHFFLGSARPPQLRRRSLTSVARCWLAVTTLDALSSRADVDVRELTPSELLRGVASGLAVIYRDDGTRYVLYFDARVCQVAAEDRSSC